MKFLAVTNGQRDASALEITLNALQIGTNVCSMLIPKLRQFLQCLVDNLLQLSQEFGIQPHGATGARLRMQSSTRAELSPRKGSTPVIIRRALRQRKTDRFWRQVPCPYLFRRHVGDGADGCSRAGQADHRSAFARALDRPRSIRQWRDLRKPEVEDFGMTSFRDKDVPRFDVSDERFPPREPRPSLGNLDPDEQGRTVPRVCQRCAAAASYLPEIPWR